MNKIIKQAFTLIELLVVIAIIGILSGLIIVGMSGMTQKATIAKAQVFSNSLRNSLLMSIVGEWKLDEGSGTAAKDTWTKTNNGTLYNFTDTTAGYGDTHTDGWMSSSNCISGPCLKFDGVDDYVDCGNGAGFNLSTVSTFSIGLWIKTNTTNIFIFGKAGNGGNSIPGYYLYTRLGFIAFDMINSGGNIGYRVQGNTTITDNIWHYVFVTYSGGNNINNVKLYVDGNLQTNTNILNTDPGDITNSISVAIGSRGVGMVSPYFIGSTDDVRIYNAAIPTSQIKEQYYAGLNKLLANGSITKQEYSERIEELTTARR